MTQREKKKGEKDVQKSVTKLFNTLLSNTTISPHTSPGSCFCESLIQVCFSVMSLLVTLLSFIHFFRQSRNENFSVCVFAGAEIADLSGAANISLLASIFFPPEKKPQKKVLLISLAVCDTSISAQQKTLWPRKGLAAKIQTDGENEIFNFANC